MTEPIEQDELTPLQEAYLHKLMATYQANLYFFKDIFPLTFEHLMRADLPLPFQIGPNGEVMLNSGRYIGSPREFVDQSRLIYRYFDDPALRPRVNVTTEFADDPNSAIPQAFSPYFERLTEPQYRLELIQRFVDMTSAPGQRLREPDFGERTLPLAVVFGTGYGWHLDRLVDDWDIKYLIILDTDIQRLNLSLYFVDYISLHQRFIARGRYLTVDYDDNAERLGWNLRGLLQRLGPPYFVQGAGLFFQDYDSDRVRALWDVLQRDMWTFYRGWGFLDDEVLGLSHALKNGSARYPLYTSKPAIPDDAVAFVIGAGPSLDPLLPVIRANRDRAVVVSCGSAITALARAGIKPDFHIEIERTSSTFAVLNDPQTRAWVSDVPIMGLPILFPEIFRITTRPLMFQKELDVGGYLVDFFEQYQRFRCNPTCTNGGVDVLLRMGFREIYLMGVDLGFKDASKHHSQASIYFDDKVEKDEILKGVVIHGHVSPQVNKAIPGNFGEEVRSTDTFIHSRDAMQMSIAEHPQARIFNLNDGALIDGAAPLHLADIAITASAESRAQAIAAMLGAFSTEYDTDPKENFRLLLQQLGAVREDFSRICAAREIHSKIDACELLFSLHEYLFLPEHQSTQIFPLLRGSLQHMGRFFYDCVGLISEQDRAVEYAKFGFDLIQRFLAATQETLESLLADTLAAGAERTAGEAGND